MFFARPFETVTKGLGSTVSSAAPPLLQDACVAYALSSAAPPLLQGAWHALTNYRTRHLRVDDLATVRVKNLASHVARVV